MVIWVGLEERLERNRKLGQSLMGLSGTSALAHAIMKTSINLPHLLELGLGGKNHRDVVGFSCEVESAFGRERADVEDALTAEGFILQNAVLISSH